MLNLLFLILGAKSHDLKIVYLALLLGVHIDGGEGLLTSMSHRLQDCLEGLAFRPIPALVAARLLRREDLTCNIHVRAHELK